MNSGQPKWVSSEWINEGLTFNMVTPKSINLNGSCGKYIVIVGMQNAFYEVCCEILLSNLLSLI